ncbi:MAG: [FeFe] hydrogenase H-cluster radical SAM maturase HydG [Cloacibacillus evryensis]
MYSKTEFQDSSFIDDAEILDSLEEAKKLAKDHGAVRAILDKARECGGLTHREAAVLLEIDDPQLEHELYALAKSKERICGAHRAFRAALRREHCVNGAFTAAPPAMRFRKKLTMEEIDREADAILALGHKRIAMEAGEDPVNIPLDYIIECMKRVYAYKNSRGDSIRRINVNIAATTVEEYQRLKAAEIGTFILFQETFHRPTYAKMHPKGPKSNYDWHTTALFRAQEGGIDDVGTGVLYGLYDYKYETVAHCSSPNRWRRPAAWATRSLFRASRGRGVDMRDSHMPTDERFHHHRRHRVATPIGKYSRRARLGGAAGPRPRHSQVSAGPAPASAATTKEIGQPEQPDTAQFKVSDEAPRRGADLALRGRLYPQHCTACYRQGRTSDRFMSL